MENFSTRIALISLTYAPVAVLGGVLRGNPAPRTAQGATSLNNYSAVIASRRFCSLAAKQSQAWRKQIASGKNKNALAMTKPE